MSDNTDDFGNLMPAVKFVLAFALILLIPAAITLNTVKDPGELTVGSDSTPLGYTWSLVLFIVPLLAIIVWLHRRPDAAFQRKSYWVTLAVLLPLGIVLDLLFGHVFFLFPNKDAVLGIAVPGVGGPIPIEEFVFYLTGFMVVLSSYLWADEYWLKEYSFKNHAREAAKVTKIVHFHLASVLWGVGILAAAVIYKKFFSGSPEGFPWYLVYLLAASVIPSAGFIRCIQRFVNWRAFWFTFSWILLVSLMWEATLASPYSWWRYKQEAMTGIFVGAWRELPVEAVLVWFAVTFTTVIIYEVIKVWLASKRKLKHICFGADAA